jgi:hypothetical protein
MAWWHAFTRRGPLPIPPPEPEALTAAAAPIATPRTELVRTPEAWQEELWGYYKTLGEFRYAVDWKSSMLSRVRLYAAKLEPGADEPIRAEAGTAVDLMTMFAGGVPGQAKIMGGLATQLEVPGEGYVTVENVDGAERWAVRSMDEVRVARERFEVLDETSPRTGTANWRPLAPDSLNPLRVWRSDQRYHHLADSPGQSARQTMRELELVNRHIIAQYLSRLASAGIIVFPQEVTFPVREEFADAPDPFLEEWIENARTAIATPGTAAATVPMPIKVPGEWVDKIKHIDFTLKIDEKIIEKRESVIKRLASQLNIPAEVLLGMSDLNHWGIWGMEEAALKTNIAPDAELICDALTIGYLQPRLRASSVEDWRSWVVWYDLSELALRPDHSDNAIQLYDRMEIDGDALRRETGFNEDDKPQSDELREQALKIIIKSLPSSAGSALSELLGEQVTITPVAAVRPREAPAPQATEATEQPTPETQNEPPPALQAARARDKQMAAQARAPHAVRFSVSRPPELLHPASCTHHAYSCPFTHAGRLLADMPRPGASGVYEARLGTFGQFQVGAPAPHLDTSAFFTTLPAAKTKRVNGDARTRS